MKSRALSLFAAFAAASSFGEDAQILWGNSVNSFSVGLAVSNSAYALEKPVLVTVYARNEASVEAPLAWFPQRWILSFVATDNSQNLVEPKNMGGYDGSAGSRQLSPGEVVKEVVDLHDYLCISQTAGSSC